MAVSRRQQLAGMAGCARVGCLVCAPRLGSLRGGWGRRVEVDVVTTDRGYPGYQDLEITVCVEPAAELSGGTAEDGRYAHAR